MGFLKASLTALLVVIVFSFASTVLITKAHAQELALESLKKASVTPTCVQKDLVFSSTPCTKSPTKKEKNAEFLPTSVLIPEIELKKEEKKIEKAVYIQPEVPFTPPTASLSADLLFEMVNNHRASRSLPAFERDAQVCAVAEARRQGISDEIFQGLPMHAGFYAMNLPYWATENMIYQHSESEALVWWLNSPVHRSAIEGNYKHACGVCNGQVCNMVFTNYDPKSIAAAPTPSISNNQSTLTSNEAKQAQVALSTVLQTTEIVKK